MRNPSRLALPDAWIAHAAATWARRGAESPHEWAAASVYDLVRDDPDRAWAFVLDVLARDRSDPTLAHLAAGPLEDLLVYHGPAVIERVESQAQRDPSFRHLLGGVWRNNIDESVWGRVQALVLERW